MGSRARQGAAPVTLVSTGPARREDVAGVVRLEERCYADPWPRDSFVPLLDNPQVFFHVARGGEVGQDVSGYVVAWFVLDEAELANLAVAPSARRQGIGGRLLDAALGEASARGTRQMFLEVRASNQAALELYGSREFEQVGRRKGYYRTPVEDALILRRTFKQELK